MTEFLFEDDDGSKSNDGYKEWHKEFKRLLGRKTRLILTPHKYKAQYEAHIDKAVHLGYFTPQHASEVKEWLREGFEREIRNLIGLKQKQKDKEKQEKKEETKNE